MNHLRDNGITVGIQAQKAQFIFQRRSESLPWAPLECVAICHSKQVWYHCQNVRFKTFIGFSIHDASPALIEMSKTEDRNTDVLPYPTWNPKVAPDASSREGDRDRHHALIVNSKENLRPLTQIGWQFFRIPCIRPCTAPGILADQEPLIMPFILPIRSTYKGTVVPQTPGERAPPQRRRYVRCVRLGIRQSSYRVGSTCGRGDACRTCLPPRFVSKPPNGSSASSRSPMSASI